MQQRIFGLDILRALAILLVVEQHGRALLSTFHNKINYLGFTDGVELFFVLSGFLIGGIIIKVYNSSENFSFKDIFHFLKRRWYRTLPNYYLSLTLNVVLILALTFQLPDKIFYYFFFLQNFNHQLYSFFQETWSLCIEEWFYLIFPFMLFALNLFFMKKASKKKIILLNIVFFISVPLVFRWFYFTGLYRPQYGEWNNIRSMVITRLDAIGFGLLGAYCGFYYKELWNNKKLIRMLLIPGLIIMVFFDRTFIYTGVYPINFFTCVFYFTIYPLGILLIMPFLEKITVYTPTFFSKAITHISVISYSMYLFHNSILIQPIYKNITLTSFKFALFLYFTYWLFVFGFSTIIYRFYEKPLMDLRDR